MATFYTLLTKTGQALLVTASATGNPVQLTHMAVGDGGGEAITPQQSQTELVHEVWRGALNTLSEDPNNEGWLLVEAVIPENVGGFTIREVGLFDANGLLVAVGNLPDSYKPQFAEGSAKTFYMRMRIEVGNASSVTLLIDPSVVLATRTWTTIEIGKVRADLDALAEDVGDHVSDVGNPHQVTAAQVGAEAFGAVAAHDGSGTAHADIRAALAGISIPSASEADAGVIKQSTIAQATAGTDNTTAMSPADVATVLLSGGVAIAGGSSDAITAAIVSQQSGLTSGMGLWVRATAANSTSTPTFNLTLGTTPTGAIGIVGPGGVALYTGAISGAGHWMRFTYDATLNKWVLANPSVTVVTTASDPTYADNSTKAASTGWIRGAMSAIATAAGFAASLTPNGYIKLPSWLGGIIIQWLGGSYRSTGGPYSNAFPIAFPTACWRVCAIPTNTSRITTLAVTSLTADQVSLTNPYSSQPEALSCDILAIGK
jgi:phage-related tail fiber protein